MSGDNLINARQNATQHAEMIVIQDSCNKLKTKYLSGTSAENSTLKFDIFTVM